MLKVASLARKIQSDPFVGEDTPARLQVYQEARKLTHKWLSMAEEELRSHRPGVASNERGGGGARAKGSIISLFRRIGTIALEALGRKGFDRRDAASVDLLVETCDLLRLFLEDAEQEIERLEQHLGQVSGRRARSRPTDGNRPRARRQSAVNSRSKHAHSAEASENIEQRIVDNHSQGTDPILRERDIKSGSTTSTRPQRHPQQPHPLPVPAEVQRSPAQAPEDPMSYAPPQDRLQRHPPTGGVDVQQPLPQADVHGSMRSRVGYSQAEPTTSPPQRDLEPDEKGPSDRGSKEERKTLAPTISSIGGHVNSQGERPTGEGQWAKQSSSPDSPRIAMPVPPARSHLPGRARTDSVEHTGPSQVHHDQGPISSSVTNGHAPNGHQSTPPQSSPLPSRVAARSSVMSIGAMNLAQRQDSTATASVASSRKAEYVKAARSKTASAASSLGIHVPAPAIPDERGRMSAIESTHSAREAHSSCAERARSEAASIRSRVRQAGATRAPALSQAVPRAMESSRASGTAAPSNTRSTSKASRAASVNIGSHARRPKTSSEASNATAVPITKAKKASIVGNPRASKAKPASRAASHNTSPSVRHQMRHDGPASSACPSPRAASRAQSAAKLTADHLAELASQASSSARSSKSRRHGRESRVKGSAVLAGDRHVPEAGAKDGQSESVFSEIDMGFVRPKRPLKCHHIDDEDNPKPEYCDSVAGTDSTVP
ncbi:hypothetical protein Tdes44962_MAKER05279 [Teratosphaeria destructans]|uniref:Uncharacterized protein n=1 Tax=Teratosphaeria destructans TaxID=418781 RepID=A0A9W7VZ13_9PEZI|nr:hypothetical protein Tdes44962_MAKER05279 [Teratosphaeria destructans]